MKKQYRLMAVLSALFITTSIFPVFTVKADTLPEETAVTEDASIADEASEQEGLTALQEETSSPSPTETLPPESTTLPESTALPASSPSPSPTETPLPESTASPDASSDEIMQQEFNALETFDLSIPVELPVFHAQIEYNFQGYVVRGTFTEFPPDACLVQPVYSLDGETYQTCGVEWDLEYLNSENANAISKLQTQICLYPSNEPLKSYLAETLDCFYLKLRITRENGITYDSQAVLIERDNTPQPVPEEAALGAMFAPSLRVEERNPFRVYGQYQLTVRAGASPDDVTQLLPATLPVEVQIEKPKLDIKKGIIDCPVTWKSISLPSLTAGESVTIADAAEEIIIPRGTLVSTPTGTFELDEPLPLDDGRAVTDEVKLVLNVVSENDSPKVGLHDEPAGLEISFDLKPTGASSLRIYTLLDGALEWTASGSLDPETINSHLFSASGYYALVLRNDQEPYQSYLAAKNAGEAAAPFLVGLEIEGGVYDKCQLILSWPSTYEGPLKIPIMGAGSGGNENNAGANNKSDSTSEGQRPDLPQNQIETSDTTTVSDTFSEVEVLYEENQSQTKDLLPENPIASTAPAPPVSQKAITDTNIVKANSTSMPSSNAKTDMQEKAITVETPSLELNASATSIPSTEKEKTDSHMRISRRKAIVSLFTISSAAIIGIGTVGKLAVLKIYGILHK